MNSKSPQLFNLPKFLDPRGNLSVIEGCQQVPFAIKRAYWVYDVPGGELRGAHAFRSTCEFIVAISGSFDVVLDTAKSEQVFSLNRSYYGLLVPEMTWRSLQNFSTNSLCLVLASDIYRPDDYIWDYELFKRMAANRNEPL